MILDILIAAIVILAMVFGFRAGFVYTFLHAAGWILSLVFAFVWSGKVKTLLMEKTDFYDSIHNLILTRFSGTLNIEQLADSFPSMLRTAVLNLAKDATQSVATSVADLIFTIVSFLIVVLVVKLVFWLLTAILSKKNNEGFTGIVDGIMGLLAGFVKGMLLVFVLLALLVPVAGLLDPKWTSVLTGWLDSSYVAGTLYNNNLIMLIVRDFLN